MIVKRRVLLGAGEAVDFAPVSWMEAIDRKKRGEVVGFLMRRVVSDRASGRQEKAAKRLL